jgi:hypothetical protein
MADFPLKPIPPEKFLEDYVPRSLRRFRLPAEARRRSLKLGLRLEGKGGGEWRFDIEHGKLRVRPGSREEASVTVIQRVEDWRGAMWEGRGGVVGRQIISTLAHGPSSRRPRQERSRRTLAALDELASLDAVVKAVVTGDRSGDWWVALKLGPGKIPKQPSATVSLSVEDADALVRGDLDLMWALMAGRLGIAGDVALMWQIQAIAGKLS